MSGAAPFREAEFLAVDLDVQRDGDGTIRLKSRVPLEVGDANLPRAIAARALAMGDKSAIAWRGTDGEWVHLRYDVLKREIDGATQWLLDHVPRGSRMILMAGNGRAAAVLTVAAWGAGVILCPVGPAYGLAGGELLRLRHVFAKTDPAVVYADPHPALAAAIEAVAGEGVTILAADPTLYKREAVVLEDVVATVPTDAVAASIEAINPDAVASYMLTSGSTGLPKLVEISLANFAANSAQGLMSIGRAAGWGDMMLDWLPWHHAAGAGLLRATLLNGGTIYVDGGKPMPGLFEESLRNMREIPVAYVNNVPLGYTMLVDAMERDPVLRATYFSKLRLMLYGGAGLPQHVHDRLQQMAVAETGHRIHMTTGYGMTESVSGCMTIHFPTDKVGIGLPAPGLEVKLVPHDDRYEVRLRGPNVTRGYLDEPAKTEEAFDAEGYYRTGDLAVFHDDARPEEGLAFAGRLAEEFKLSNGTWVYGGQLREALLKALAPHVGELVLCDDNRDYLGVLAWGKPGAPDDLLDLVAEQLRVFNSGQRGGSATVKRVALFDRPPNPGANEMSDKGTINRRAVLDNRPEDLERLYAAVPGDGVRAV